MKDITLVKAKIVLSDDGKGLVIYMWNKVFWIFGYWYAFGARNGVIISKEELANINDDTVSKLLFENFIDVKNVKTDKK
jgi:hypothetical protein